MGMGVHSLKHLRNALCACDKVGVSVAFVLTTLCSSFFSFSSIFSFSCFMSASCLVQAVSFSLPTLSNLSKIVPCGLFAFPWTASDNFCEASEINCLAVSCSAICAISSCACSTNCSCKCLLVLCSTFLASSASYVFFSSLSSSACLS